MKRGPILVSFVLFVGLCASGAFWAMQLFKPAVRPVAASKQQAKMAVDTEAAVGLFGGRPMVVAAASNFQLKGVVVANNGRESVAILVANGKPAEAFGINAEATPGVTVKEVHSQYVLLSEGGVVKRVELPVAAQSKLESPIGAVGQAMQPGIQPNMAQGQGVPQQSPPPEIEPPPPSPQNLPGRVIGRAAARMNGNQNNN